MQWHVLPGEVGKAHVRKFRHLKYLGTWRREDGMTAVVVSPKANKSVALAFEVTALEAKRIVHVADATLALKLVSDCMALLVLASGKPAIPPQVVRAFALRDPDQEPDPLMTRPPGIILEFASFVLAFDPDREEVEYFTSVHHLQVAHVIDGGTFDSLYTEDEEVAAYWRDAEQVGALWETIDVAVNCTPGEEGQTPAVAV